MPKPEKQLNLVFLPATEPENTNYGIIPQAIAGYPEATCLQVSYADLVWYNVQIRREAVLQIRAFDVAPLILVGFSKSGLGAWNITQSIPELVSGTIIFDAPMVRQSLPPWGTRPFYQDDEAWRRDLPLHSIKQFKQSRRQDHRLILISGQGFAGEMQQMSKALSEMDCQHVFLSRPQLLHHWNSGWLEAGLWAMALRSQG